MKATFIFLSGAAVSWLVMQNLEVPAYPAVVGLLGLVSTLIGVIGTLVLVGQRTLFKSVTGLTISVTKLSTVIGDSGNGLVREVQELRQWKHAMGTADANVKKFSEIDGRTEDMQQQLDGIARQLNQPHGSSA